MGIAASFLSDLEHGRRALGARHISRLPAALLAPVTEAMIAEREADIVNIREAGRAR